jgi:hypothetical protein
MEQEFATLVQQKVLVAGISALWRRYPDRTFLQLVGLVLRRVGDYSYERAMAVGDYEFAGAIASLLEETERTDESA